MLRDAPKDLKVETRWKASPRLSFFSHQWVALCQCVIPSLQAYTQSPWVHKLINGVHMTSITTSTSPNCCYIIAASPTVQAPPNGVVIILIWLLRKVNKSRPPPTRSGRKPAQEQGEEACPGAGRGSIPIDSIPAL